MTKFTFLHQLSTLTNLTFIFAPKISLITIPNKRKQKTTRVHSCHVEYSSSYPPSLRCAAEDKIISSHRFAYLASIRSPVIIRPSLPPPGWSPPLRSQSPWRPLMVNGNPYRFYKNILGIALTALNFTVKRLAGCHCHSWGVLWMGQLARHSLAHGQLLSVDASF